MAINVCILIPMHNFGELTKKCIDLTLENAGVPIDIFVVDDGSEIPYKDNRVKIIRLENNVGFTEAVNIGIQEIWNKYMFIHILNNDTEPHKDFVKELMGAFKEHHAIGVTASVRATQVDGKTALFTFPIDCVSGMTAFNWSEDELPDDLFYAPWIPFCSVMIKSDVLKQVGLLDARMKNHCSDNDFCVRAWQLGFHTALVPKSIVTHHHETTTRSMGIDASKDQALLMTKVRCDFMRSVLEAYPLDGNTKKMYELVFREKVSHEEVMPNESQKTS